MNDWLKQTELNRASATKRGIGTALGFMIAIIAFAGQRSVEYSLLSTISIAAGSLTLTYALIDFFVRIKTIKGKPSYLILMPGDPQSPNSNTYPYRLVITEQYVELCSKSETLGHWARKELYDVNVTRVWSLRPLGYLSFKTSSNENIAGRIFQPKIIKSLLEAK